MSQSRDNENRHRPRDNQGGSGRPRPRPTSRNIDNNTGANVGNIENNPVVSGGPGPYPDDGGSQELMSYAGESAYSATRAVVGIQEYGAGIDNSRTSSGYSFSCLAEGGSFRADDLRSPRQQNATTNNVQNTNTSPAFPDEPGYSIQTTRYSSSSSSDSRSDVYRTPWSEHVLPQETALRGSGGVWTDTGHLAMSPGPNYAVLTAADPTSSPHFAPNRNQHHASDTNFFGNEQPYSTAMAPDTEELFSSQSSGSSMNVNGGSETSNGGATLDSGDTVRYNSLTRRRMRVQRNVATYEFVTARSRRPDQSHIEATLSHHGLVGGGGGGDQQLREVPAYRERTQGGRAASSEYPQHLQQTSQYPQAAFLYPQYSTGEYPQDSAPHSVDQEYSTGYTDEEESFQGAWEYGYPADGQDQDQDQSPHYR